MEALDFIKLLINVYCKAELEIPFHTLIDVVSYVLT